MAKRDFFKTVALVPDGLLPSRYEIDLEEIRMLYAEVKTRGRDGLWNVICWCMCYGYVMGHRATKNGIYREAKKKDRQHGNADGLKGMDYQS